MPIIPILHSLDVVKGHVQIILVAAVLSLLPRNVIFPSLRSLNRQCRSFFFVFLWLQETAMVNNTIVLPNSQILTTRGIWSFMTQQAKFNYFRRLRLYLMLPSVSGMGAK
jgi:hypothetical protein